MELREISTLPLAPSVVESLLKNGFRVLKDAAGLRPMELAQEASITPQEALEVLNAINSSTAAPAEAQTRPSAKDLYIKGKELRPIITFCRSIDSMLGGGVQTGHLTEFCGVPGVGKTQISIQLALDAQIPCEFAGVGGEAVYIDTEGSFMVERVVEMAQALVEHLRRIGKNRKKQELLELSQSITVESLLSGIHVLRVHDQTEQIAAIRNLPALLEERPRVKLVIVDSVAFHFRQDLQDTAARARQLSSLAQQLNSLAHNHSLAVVLINQVTTKMERMASGEMRSQLVPALGESWSHAVTSRVMLYWQDNARHARLVKSPSRPADVVRYTVSDAGVRDEQTEEQNKRPRNA